MNTKTVKEKNVIAFMDMLRYAVQENKKVNVFNKKETNFISSYTCCNIEVSETKGTEVMCPECKEWVTTK